jgi:hypothetical protein
MIAPFLANRACAERQSRCPLEPVLGRLSLFRDSLNFIQNHTAPSIWKTSHCFESGTIAASGHSSDLHSSNLERAISGEEQKPISWQGSAFIPGRSFRAERLDFQTWWAIP